MQCTALNHMRHPTTRLWLTYPCGQCINCRIRKQSSWTLRNLLEYQTSLSGQFWTLTLDDNAMQTLADTGPKKMMRYFFNRLRHSERQHSNLAPIRYYGCYELGTLSGRPHFHLLLYNLVKNQLQLNNSNTKWGQQHTALWPHGHIDVGHITQASIRYVSDYMTKFDTNGTAPSSIPFRTSRPAIGYYGIQHALLTLAGPSLRLPAPPAYFQINNRKYPLDQWTRNTFEKLRKKHKIKYDYAPEPIDRKHEQIAMHMAKDEHFYKLEFLRNRELKAKMDLNDGKKKILTATYKLRNALTSVKTSKNLSATQTVLTK